MIKDKPKEVEKDEGDEDEGDEDEDEDEGNKTTEADKKIVIYLINKIVELKF